MMTMMNKLKKMAMSGLKMLTTKKGMLAAILFGAPLVGIAVSPEYAASLAEHLSILLEMMLDALPDGAEEAVTAASTTSE